MYIRYVDKHIKKGFLPKKKGFDLSSNHGEFVRLKMGWETWKETTGFQRGKTNKEGFVGQEFKLLYECLKSCAAHDKIVVCARMSLAWKLFG